MQTLNLFIKACMSLVNITMYRKCIAVVTVCLTFHYTIQAQTINSPYSRYGVGDIITSQNMLTRGMGGIGAAYYDYQSINFLNPASYGRLRATTFDFGLEIDNVTLRSTNPPDKYSNASPLISYIQLGFPLKKNGGWGAVIGLRPISRINYKIERLERLTDGTLNDSIQTVFEGNGGAEEVYVGTGVTVGNFSAGVNIGYLFGSKDYTSRRGFIDDSVFHYLADYETNSNFGGLFLNGGIQYTVPLSKKDALQFGAYGNLKRNLNASKEVLIQTFRYNANSGVDSIDVVSRQNTDGDLVFPASYGAGLIYNRTGKFLIGLDYSAAQWGDYRLFNEKDLLQNTWEVHAGAQVLPSGGKNYFSNAAYRAGFSFGKDYVSVDGQLSKWSASLGAGLPMRRANYTNQFSVINVALEFTQRGNKNNLVKESSFKVAIGFSLSDIWFLKRKYD